MNDLREQIVKTLQGAGWPMSAERAVANVWPIIEAELLNARNDAAEAGLRSAQHAEDLQIANQLFEQTIEVLEAMPGAIHTGRYTLWRERMVKPLLDKLQALKKEGTE